jgi:hypothetical protein
MTDEERKDLELRLHNLDVNLKALCQAALVCEHTKAVATKIDHTDWAVNATTALRGLDELIKVFKSGQDYYLRKLGARKVKIINRDEKRKFTLIQGGKEE